MVKIHWVLLDVYVLICVAGRYMNPMHIELHKHDIMIFLGCTA